MIILLAAGACSLLVSDASGSTFLSWDARDWAVCSIILAVAHQVIVAIVFRLELYRGLMTRIFHERALRVWSIIFLPLLIARPVSIFFVGWLDPIPISGFRTLELTVGIPLILLAIVTMH